MFHGVGGKLRQDLQDFQDFKMGLIGKYWGSACQLKLFALKRTKRKAQSSKSKSQRFFELANTFSCSRGSMVEMFVILGLYLVSCVFC
jgi:hypothetical protein